MKNNYRNRYESIGKRSFRSAIIRMLEEEYKIIGSHKVIGMIANDIVELQKKFYPEVEKQPLGSISWRTTALQSKKPSYGTRVEDYEIKAVVLPLVTAEDVEKRINWYYGHPKKNENYQRLRDRDIEVMARLVKSAYEQGGLLSGAELSVLMNRSLSTIGKYMRIYHEQNDDILPTKGMILDQGSRPTHKAAIVNLYEQGYPEVDIARLTNHQIESTSRYIKAYKKIKMLMERELGLIEMVRITGMGKSTITQYRDLVYIYHPKLKPKDQTRSKPPSTEKEGDEKQNLKNKK